MSKPGEFHGAALVNQRCAKNYYKNKYAGVESFQAVGGGQTLVSECDVGVECSGALRLGAVHPFHSFRL